MTELSTDEPPRRGALVEDGGRFEHDLASLRRTSSEWPADAHEDSCPASATPLVLRGRPTDPQTRVGWYGSVSQVLNQQGHDAGAERGLQCLPNLGF